MISFSIFQHPKTNIYEQHNNLHPMIYGLWNSLIGAKLKPNTHFRFLKCAIFWPNVLALRWWTSLHFSNRLTAVVNYYRLKKNMSELNASKWVLQRKIEPTLTQMKWKKRNCFYLESTKPKNRPQESVCRMRDSAGKKKVKNKKKQIDWVENAL